MKKNRLFFIIFYVLITYSVTYSGTFDDALSQAKDEGKILIVDVYTDWCGWCKKMDRDTYDNSKVKEIINKSFVYVKLNAESDDVNHFNGKKYSSAELAVYFQVSGYPTHVFIDSDGNVIEFNYDKSKLNNLPGYFPADNFKKILKYFRDEDYKDTDLSTIIQ